MAEWVGLAADWLKPIYRQIREEVLEGGYVQIDETPIRYLEPGHGKTKLGYLWTYGVPKEDVVFHWETSRAATCLENILPVEFRGVAQCDGYQAYRSFARSRDDAIVLAGCMAHVRRKFFEAQEQAPKVAGWILWQMRNLYTIESELRETRAGPNLRAAIRCSQSRMIMNRLHHALVALKTSRRFLPRSLMGGAIDYALGQWSTLLVYLDDGRLEIDNNLIENAIRPTAVGKKNWLFIGEAAAGERSAILLHRHRELPPARDRSVLLSQRGIHQAPLHDQLAGQGHHAQSMGKAAESHPPCNRSVDVIAPSALTSMTKTAIL
jgi:hypothetical protein